MRIYKLKLRNPKPTDDYGFAYIHSSGKAIFLVRQRDGEIRRPTDAERDEMRRKFQFMMQPV